MSAPATTEAVPAPISGSQYTITHGDYSATIASVGASLRVLRHGGRDLTLSYAAEEVRPGYRGVLLAPWPNRVIGGRYQVDGTEYSLPLNEAELGNAIHGLVQWLDWQLVERTQDKVTLSVELQASDSYPFRLLFTVTYSLTESGLRTEVRVANTGTATAPYGVSTHPYFVAPGNPDTWRVSAEAARVLTVDERLAPAELVPVDVGDGTFDLRAAPELNGRFIDNAYTDITRDHSGHAVISLTGADGLGVSIEFGEDFRWAQVYTGALNDADGPSVAIEPMTCPPNAFVSGTDLIHIAPAAEVSHSWRIRAIG